MVALVADVAAQSRQTWALGREQRQYRSGIMLIILQYTALVEVQADGIEETVQRIAIVKVARVVQMAVTVGSESRRPRHLVPVLAALVDCTMAETAAAHLLQVCLQLVVAQHMAQVAAARRFTFRQLVVLE
jgi:hypothetical protein